MKEKYFRPKDWPSALHTCPNPSPNSLCFAFCLSHRKQKEQKKAAPKRQNLFEAAGQENQKR
ncbi:MAG: hypothetical protein MJ077_11575 [Oscillospiraceae bacterium]|nr:hypothetical protein [Oscillospiraceae bacterium]